MTIQGSFRNYNDDLITVKITTSDSSSSIINIGEDGLYFSGDPIQIETDNDDTFNHIIRKSCTINLKTNKYIGDKLFADNARSNKVVITNETNGNCLFYGFIDPNTFSQPFAKVYEEFTVNCIDTLSTLQYYNYKNLTPNTYDDYKVESKIVTFKEVIDTMFEDFIDGDIFYDMSRGISSDRTKTIFDDVAISEDVFLEEEADNVWNYEDVLTQILQYLNLHIIQEGKKYYIFDWESIRNKKEDWYNLTSNIEVTNISKTIDLISSMHSDSDTNISIADVYNQIQVTDNLNSQDTIITSPLDDDSLSSLYKGKQKYMTEYISEGSGDKAHDAFVNMIMGKSHSYSEHKEVDWYIQAMYNTNWKFYHNGQNVNDLVCEHNSNGTYINQWKVAKYLYENSCVPYIFSLGSIEKKSTAENDRPTSKIDMTNYLYISINGNEYDVSDTSASPTDDTIQEASPMIEYYGTNSGGVFSPSDDETTNYLVFSGKILLQPIVYETSINYADRKNNYAAIKKNGGCRKTEGNDAQLPSYVGNYDGYTFKGGYLGYVSNIVKSDNNDEGRYYTRQFYAYINPTDKYPTSESYVGIQPWTDDKSAHGFKYQYSYYGNNYVAEDKMKKLAILDCELIIGNKRLIETDIDDQGNSTYKWVKLGEEPTITVDGTSYKITTFSLGINPVIDDYIIGDEFDIQNTIDYQMNLDTEGTAIPITKADALNGQVIFRILGPVNSIWNDVTRRHPSFWRHTKWSNDDHYILAHTQNIIIKDFECKIYSDNALQTITGNNDLIYMSAETDKYVNKKDDIDFDIITQLTSSECVEKGIENSYNINAAINNTTSLPLTSIYNTNTGETAKPEEHYVDCYYREYNQPKILMETSLHNSDKIRFNYLYNSKTLSKTFYPIRETFDVKRDNKTLTLKEL